MASSCAHVALRRPDGSCLVCDDDPAAAALSIAQEELRAEEEAAAVELAELDADAARLDLAEFVRQAWHVLEPGDLEWNWHHEAICKNVQGMLEEWLRCKQTVPLRPTVRGTMSALARAMRWQKLLLNICPSTLKSRILMVFAPAWMWLREATWSVLCVSANPSNVTRDAEACRDLITSLWYRQTFGVQWKIREDIDSKAKFATTAGGMRQSRGLVAKFVGIHVDAIFVDDPDDAHDVHSEAARRERAGKIEAISSRLNDKRRFVMILAQQRVHVDDATGDALAHGGWLHASYPLQYHAGSRRDTPFFVDPRAEEGENLHPARFTDDVIAAIKLELGSFGFEAQYNQNPAPLEGGMIQRLWFRYFTVAGQRGDGFNRPVGARADEAVALERNSRGKLDIDWIAISVDATFGSLSETASAVGLLLVVGKGTARYVLLDRTRPMTYPDTKDAIREIVRECAASDMPVTHILIEKKANGAAIVDELGREFSGVIALEVEGGKESRAFAMSPAIESGCVFLLDGSAWLDAFLAEVCVFPYGKRDDRVDALSQLLAYFAANAPRKWSGRWLNAKTAGVLARLSARA